MGPKDGGTGEERKEEVRAGRTQVLNRLGYSILQMRKQPRKEKR
jgi:very-short-patch-repair endonuclease